MLGVPPADFVMATTAQDRRFQDDMHGLIVGTAHCTKCFKKRANVVLEVFYVGS